ncbi:hypothetical protein G7Z17_g4603 [Cylindrodendrum hubeiense]|uniref:Zn(2)-C6 fungal-type domain-containing protein n=1 Tax=Cylindrodendrum hubeiense TaxID=595255 RepID=A0A9P5HGK2_9HYPO|nr:hypothetical protein G7Z17_g4603 [Cylindrodendrum hubeiense]
MFGTWKYDPETDEVQSVRNAFDPVTARSSSHQACDRCHEKKLKCSGDKNGCERCIGNNLRCEYTRSGTKSSRKGKKTSRKSEEDSAASGSGSSSRRGGSSSKKSSGKHHHHSSRTTTSGHEEPEGLLGQFDFSSLSPEDGFDLGLLSPSADQTSGGGYAVPVSAAALQGAYPQMQHGVSDVNYPAWDGYSAYPAAYDQQQGYPAQDWANYGEYSGQPQQDPRYYSGRPTDMYNYHKRSLAYDIPLSSHLAILAVAVLTKNYSRVPTAPPSSPSPALPEFIHFRPAPGSAAPIRSRDVAHRPVEPRTRCDVRDCPQREILPRGATPGAVAGWDARRAVMVGVTFGVMFGSAGSDAIDKSHEAGAAWKS